MHWRGITWSAAAALAAAMALSACGGSGPEPGSDEAERVAVRWLKAMADSNVKLACRLMDAENHQPHRGYPSWSAAKNCQERWLHSDNTPVGWKPKGDGVVSIWGDSHPKVIDVTVEGGRATVLVEGIADEGRPVWLRRESGRWLVDGAEYPI